MILTSSQGGEPWPRQGMLYFDFPWEITEPVIEKRKHGKNDLQIPVCRLFYPQKKINLQEKEPELKEI